jgi:hypothetical protein
MKKCFKRYRDGCGACFVRQKCWIRPLVIGSAVFAALVAALLLTLYFTQNNPDKPTPPVSTTGSVVTIPEGVSTTTGSVVTIPEGVSTTTGVVTIPEVVPTTVDGSPFTNPVTNAGDIFVEIVNVKNVYTIMPEGLPGEAPTIFGYSRNGGKSMKYAVVLIDNVYYAVVFPQTKFALAVNPKTGNLNLDVAIWLGADGTAGTADDKFADFVADVDSAGWYIKKADGTLTLLQELTKQQLKILHAYAFSEQMNNALTALGIETAVETGEEWNKAVLLSLLLLPLTGAGVALASTTRRKME